jgi:hypothetical protein
MKYFFVDTMKSLAKRLTAEALLTEGQILQVTKSSYVKQQGKQNLYSPVQALRASDRRGSHISRQLAYEVGKFINSKQRPLYPPGNIPRIHLG